MKYRLNEFLCKSIKFCALICIKLVSWRSYCQSRSWLASQWDLLKNILIKLILKLFNSILRRVMWPHTHAGEIKSVCYGRHNLGKCFGCVLRDYIVCFRTWRSLCTCCDTCVCSAGSTVSLWWRTALSSALLTLSPSPSHMPSSPSSLTWVRRT